MSAQFERQARANERDRKRAIRAKIKELRSRLRHAKRWRSQRLRDVRRVCRAALRLARQRSKEIRASERARAKLATQHRIAELYQAERAACEARKVQARHKAAEGAARASALLAAELEDLRRTRIYADPNPLRRKGGTPRRATAAELRAESDDEVRGNIPAELAPVWEKMRGKIKGKDRTSRTEQFLEWAAEHGADVRAIIDAEIEASVAELVREEAAQRRALGEGGPSRTKTPRKPSRSKRAYRAALVAALGMRPEQPGDRYRLTTDELLDSLRRDNPARAHELQRAWPEWAPDVHDPAAPPARVAAVYDWPEGFELDLATAAARLEEARSVLAAAFDGGNAGKIARARAKLHKAEALADALEARKHKIIAKAHAAAPLPRVVTPQLAPVASWVPF